MNDQPHFEPTQGFRPPPITDREMTAIVGGVMLAMLLAALDQTIVAPAMPTIGAHLGHAHYLPWIVTAYLLTSTATAPLYGRISDMYGRRPTIAGAVIVFVLGSVICALAQNMFVLIAGRAVQGLGGGGLFALTQTIIGDLVPPRERGRFAAWISGTWAVASVAGPLLGGYFADHLHWSLIFWINVPLGALALLIMNRPLRKLQVERQAHRFDVVGAFLLILATAALLLALNWGGATYPWLSAPVLLLFVASGLIAALLGFHLTRAKAPLISIEILRNPIVRAATAAMFMAQAGNVGLTVFLPIYLQHGLGLSVSASGTALLGLLLGTVAGAWMSGRLLLRVVRYKLMALAGAAISFGGLCVLAFTAAGASLLWVEILTVFIGYGMGLTFPIAIVAAQNAVKRAELGATTGVVTFLRSLGGAFGVAVLGAIALGYGIPMAREGAAVEIADAAVADNAFAIVFATSAGMMALVFLGFALMRQKPLQGREDEN
ncbi:MDR family MFS transporter [Lutibaculum baratangense]|nr:MDR family MFS transporter [Lutibaculum baratangense]